MEASIQIEKQFDEFSRRISAKKPRSTCKHVEINGLLKHVAENGHDRRKEIEVLQQNRKTARYVGFVHVFREKTDEQYHQQTSNRPVSLIRSISEERIVGGGGSRERE